MAKFVAMPPPHYRQQRFVVVG